MRRRSSCAKSMGGSRVDPSIATASAFHRSRFPVMPLCESLKRRQQRQSALFLAG